MWRDTGLPVRVLMLDARALLPVLCFVVKWSWITFYIAVSGIAFFGTMAFFGLTLPAATRLMRRVLAGSTRTAMPAWKRRRLA
jgi:intracellular multiplication protein IcmT